MLQTAVELNRHQMVLFLLEHGYDVDAKNYLGNTALYEAAELNSGFSHSTVMKSLLEHGANPNERNDRGQTPFHRVLRKGDWDTVSLFLEHRTLCK